jgi:hypothetical protein
MTCNLERKRQLSLFLSFQAAAAAAAKGTTQIFVSLADLSFVMVNNSVGVPLAYMGLVRWGG